MDDIEYARLLDLTYEAAVDADLWPEVMRAYANASGAKSSTFIQQNEVTGVGRGMRIETDPEATQLYYGYFATRNAFLQVSDPRETLRKWAPTITTDEHRIEKSALMRTEYYNDFMRRFDIHSLLIVRVALRGMETLVLNLTRPNNREQFGAAEIDLMGRLQPHLIRAYKLSERLAVERGVQRDLAEALDHTASGVFVLDAGGRVLHANRAGERLLAARDGVCMIGGKLAAVAPPDANRLRNLIDAAGSLDGLRRSGGSMTIASLARRLPLHVTVTPNRTDNRANFFTPPGVLVCVTDVEADMTLPQDRLRMIFGFTGAEVRLVQALFEGLELKEAAERFGVSVHTVHAQLYRIFQKTGARRQSELMKLVSQVAAANLH